MAVSRKERLGSAIRLTARMLRWNRQTPDNVSNTARRRVAALARGIRHILTKELGVCADRILGESTARPRAKTTCSRDDVVRVKGRAGAVPVSSVGRAGKVTVNPRSVRRSPCNRKRDLVAAKAAYAALADESRRRGCSRSAARVSQPPAGGRLGRCLRQRSK